MRKFYVWTDDTGVKLGATPPEISPLQPDGVPREVREMSLDKSSTPLLSLAVLSVADTANLDQILELLKHTPRLHSVDIPETKQYVEAFARYSTWCVPTSRA